VYCGRIIKDKREEVLSLPANAQNIEEPRQFRREAMDILESHIAVLESNADGPLLLIFEQPLSRGPLRNTGRR
jgi:hypothetical protein